MYRSPNSYRTSNLSRCVFWSSNLQVQLLKFCNHVQIWGYTFLFINFFCNYFLFINWERGFGPFFNLESYAAHNPLPKNKGKYDYIWNTELRSTLPLILSCSSNVSHRVLNKINCNWRWKYEFSLNLWYAKTFYPASVFQPSNSFSWLQNALLSSSSDSSYRWTYLSL